MKLTGGLCAASRCVVATLFFLTLQPPLAVHAQSEVQPPPVKPERSPFGYVDVVKEAELLAAEAYQPPEAPTLAKGLADLGYDGYRAIRTPPQETLWRSRPGFFRVQFFPAGFIYTQPVGVNIVSDGVAEPFVATAKMFDWSDAELPEVPEGPVPLAGFRLLFPLHEPELDDEVTAFLGASYFRLLGREQIYGISARGLAIDTGEAQEEEFPRFRTFWLVEPAPEARGLTFYALLDSPGLTGAYEFHLRPGTETSLVVKATLFPRHDIALVGFAPLTSMFLAGENMDRRETDFRPEVHDSDGLLIETGGQEWIWRPLENPTEFRVSAFAVENPRGFGLLQRDRDFDHYQDLQALYHRRSSLWVEPLSDWGEGEIRLLEIPTDSEIHDNITAFWVPKMPFKGDQRLEVSYRLHALSEAPRFPPRARAVATRSSNLPEGARRIFVDFEGPDLAVLRPEQPLEGQVDVQGGELLATRVQPIEDEGRWRLVMDIQPDPDKEVEIRAFLRLYDEVFTETWLYRLKP